MEGGEVEGSEIGKSKMGERKKVGVRSGSGLYVYY